MLATGDRMHRAALLLCGDHHLAEDLTQTTYAKVYAAWSTVSAADSPSAYTRTVLLRTFLSHRGACAAPRSARSASCPRRRRPGHGPDLRLDLLAALRLLSPADRAVLVLRYWEDLSVAHTAQPPRHPRDHLPGPRLAGAGPAPHPCCPTLSRPRTSHDHPARPHARDRRQHPHRPGHPDGAVAPQGIKLRRRRRLAAAGSAVAVLAVVAAGAVAAGGLLPGGSARPVPAPAVGSIIRRPSTSRPARPTRHRRRHRAPRPDRRTAG